MGTKVKQIWEDSGHVIFEDGDFLVFPKPLVTSDVAQGWYVTELQYCDDGRVFLFVFHPAMHDKEYFERVILQVANLEFVEKTQE